MIDDLIWLFEWYASQCDKYWEVWYGIIIETTGDSEWKVSISIDETELKDLNFNEVSIWHSKNDWLKCFVYDDEFIGICSPLNLLKIFYYFKAWANPEIHIVKTSLVYRKKNELLFINFLQWYKDLCDAGLDCKRRIMISTLENPGWDLCVDLHGTKLETKEQILISVDRTEEDWFRCFTKEGYFNGPGGLSNLFEILDIFTQFRKIK